jgi:flagellar biosynthesis/type III secretory pathway chaperone
MNDSDFEKLSLLLGRLVEFQKKLLELQEQKTKILVQGNIKELDNILIQEQPLILNCSSLEKQRMKLLDVMGFSRLTLEKIIQVYDPEDEHGLAISFDELKDVLVKLKKQNGINNKILHSRLSAIHQCMSFIGLKENAFTYKEDGYL